MSTPSLNVTLIAERDCGNCHGTGWRALAPDSGVYLGLGGERLDHPLQVKFGDYPDTRPPRHLAVVDDVVMERLSRVSYVKAFTEGTDTRRPIEHTRTRPCGECGGSGRTRYPLSLDELKRMLR